MDTLVDVILGHENPYVTWAVPAFFLLIGIEIVISLLGRRPLYRLSDSINDLSCGILQQLTDIFIKGALWASYYVLYQRFAILDIANFSPAGKWGAFVALFFGVDLCYYWFHRISHQMNGPWAGHIVHHSSEEYNLSVALRQSSLQAFFSWAFYLPLAIVGFPPAWTIAMLSLNILYQFWIHTRAIGKLGPLEWVLNTPSHHRVHHGRNPKYLDKNHAGVLIIWDRMFGTFIEEDEEPVYGLVRPLASWDPLWANVHEFKELWEDAVRAPFWWDKIRIWFMPPGWRPRGIPERPDPPEVNPDTVVKYDTRIPAGLAVYATVQFALTLSIAVGILVTAPTTSVLWLMPGIIWSAWSLKVVGGIFERRVWVIPQEPVRFLGLVGIIGMYLSGTPYLLLAVISASVISVISLVWLWLYRTEFRTPAGVRTKEAYVTTNAVPRELSPASP